MGSDHAINSYDIFIRLRPMDLVFAALSGVEIDMKIKR